MKRAPLFLFCVFHLIYFFSFFHFLIADELVSGKRIVSLMPIPYVICAVLPPIELVTFGLTAIASISRYTKNRKISSVFTLAIIFYAVFYTICLYRLVYNHNYVGHGGPYLGYYLLRTWTISVVGWLLLIFYALSLMKKANRG
jgi:hypothetical protein